jgi:hypothetical protein
LGWVVDEGEGLVVNVTSPHLTSPHFPSIDQQVLYTVVWEYFGAVQYRYYSAVYSTELDFFLGLLLKQSKHTHSQNTYTVQSRTCYPANTVQYPLPLTTTPIDGNDDDDHPPETMTITLTMTTQVSFSFSFSLSSSI